MHTLDNCRESAYHSSMTEVQVNLTPDQRHAIERGEPLHGSDPDQKTRVVLLSEATFDRLKTFLLPALEGDIDPSAAYPLSDEVMKEDWDDPKMAEYDDYESRRR